jgi:hypothetical protein
MLIMVLSHHAIKLIFIKPLFKMIDYVYNPNIHHLCSVFRFVIFYTGCKLAIATLNISDWGIYRIQITNSFGYSSTNPIQGTLFPFCRTNQIKLPHKSASNDSPSIPIPTYIHFIQDITYFVDIHPPICLFLD